MICRVPPTEILRLLMQQAQVQGSRSTVLNPLGWLLAILLATLTACQFAHADHWVSVALAVAAGVTVLLYLTAYVYFAMREPDALRSERYSLSKMAIERSRTGDDLSGFVVGPPTTAPPAAIESPAPKPLEGPT